MQDSPTVTGASSPANRSVRGGASTESSGNRHARPTADVRNLPAQMGQNLTFLASLSLALHTLMAKDPNVVVLGEDPLEQDGNTSRIAESLARRFPNRVLTMPSGEASIVGVATGLALSGMRSIAEIAFGDFVALATDQLVNYASKYPVMYDADVAVPLVVRMPVGADHGDGPAPSQSLEKLYLGVPNLTVVAPSHFHAAGELLTQATQSTHPVLFLENKLLYPLPLALAPEMDGLSRSEFSNGSLFPSVLLRNYRAPEKADVAVIAYGGLSRLLEPALRWLGERDVRVVACLAGTLHPLTVEPILACAREAGRVLVVEEGSSAFGWAAEVSTRIYDTLFSELVTPVRRLGALDSVIPANRTLEQRVRVSEEAIISAVLELMRW